MPSRRGLLRLIIPVLAVAVIAGGSWVAFSGALAPARLASELQRAALRATGRSLTIAGPVRISLGIAPSVSVENVSLASIPGAAHPQMVTAARVTAQVALIPLLSGDLVFESVTIVAPEIVLERSADGTPNWQFSSTKRPLTETGQGTGQGGGDAGGETEIHVVHIEGGHVTWQPAGGAPINIGIGRADLSADTDTGPTKLAVQGTANGQAFTVKVVAGSIDRLRGGPTTALAGAWPLTVDATGAGGILHVEGGITHPDQMRGYSFAMTANLPDLSALQPAFPQLPLPALRDLNFNTRFSDGTTGELRTSGLSLHTGASNLSASVPGLAIKEATISAPGPGQMVQASIEGVYQGTTLRIAGTATQPDFNSTSQPIAGAFSAQIASASLSARGTFPGGLGMNGLDLDVSARIPDLSDFSGLAGRTLPAAKDLAFNAKLGDAGFRLRGIAFRDLNLQSSLGDVSGTLTVAWAPIIDVQGTLQSKTLDVDALGLGGMIRGATSAAPQDIAPAAPEDGAILPDRKLPVAALRSANADVSLTLGTVVAGGETLHDFQARLQAADGKIALNPFRVTAPEGVVIGGASIDASTDTPPIAINLRSPSLSSAMVAAALGYPGAASGPMQVDAQLNGVGAGTRALLASLSGHLGVSMVGGQVSDAIMQHLLGGALGAAGVTVGGGASQVNCFAMRADLHDGRGSFEALALDTSRLSMDGTGSFDLGQETLNLHLRPSLMLGGAAAAAPVSVKGSFAAPNIALDPVLSGRVGFSIGGTQASSCVSMLHVARGGMPGPMPTATPPASPMKIKKPIDLLRGLLHH